jgi:hypothetical protein
MRFQFKMKIIEPKGDIYDVLSDGVAGENCIVYIMVQLMYLATWKEYTTLKLYKFRSVRRTGTRIRLQRI